MLNYLLSLYPGYVYAVTFLRDEFNELIFLCTSSSGLFSLTMLTVYTYMYVDFIIDFA